MTTPKTIAIDDIEMAAKRRVTEESRDGLRFCKQTLEGAPHTNERK
jgi:hypothetical protein